MSLTRIIDKNKIQSQYEYFKMNGACDDILRLILFSNKRFGSVMEEYVSHELCMTKVSLPDYDLIDRVGFRYELKCSRRHITGNWNFLHIDEEKSFDFILFLRVDFHTISIHGIDKNTLFNSGVLRRQGSQGWMCNWNNIKDIVVEIY